MSLLLLRFLIRTLADCVDNDYCPDGNNVDGLLANDLGGVVDSKAVGESIVACAFVRLNVVERGLDYPLYGGTVASFGYGEAFVLSCHEVAARMCRSMHGEDDAIDDSLPDDRESGAVVDDVVPLGTDGVGALKAIGDPHILDDLDLKMQMSIRCVCVVCTDSMRGSMTVVAKFSFISRICCSSGPECVLCHSAMRGPVAA